MPRCHNNKSVQLTSHTQENNSNTVYFADSSDISNKNYLELGGKRPQVEKSYRRVRCDLSPAPVNQNSHLNSNLNYIKLFNSKVKKLITLCYVTFVGAKKKTKH